MPRRLYAGACALAFLAFGLWIGGAAGRVHALARAAASSPRISPIDGSSLNPARELVLDGQPTRLRRCVAPKTMSVSAVRDHYEELARRESRFASGDELPYVAVDQAEGAYVLWTCAEDGHRKGVIVQRSSGVVEYTLMDSTVAETKSGGSLLLPGGAAAPSGARAGLTIEDGGASFTFFDAPGAPAEVAGQLEGSLAKAGFAVDEPSRAEMDAVSHAARGQSRVVVPFQGKDKKGFIVVAASGRGSSRATVVVR